MEIRFEQDGDRLLVRMEGRLDIDGTPELEKALDNRLDGITELVLDFARVAYVSSVGLRLLISLKKCMAKQEGTMSVINVQGLVKEVFIETGLSSLFELQDE